MHVTRTLDLHFEEVLDNFRVIPHSSEVNWSSLKAIECVQLGLILHEQLDCFQVADPSSGMQGNQLLTVGRVDNGTVFEQLAHKLTVPTRNTFKIFRNMYIRLDD